MSLILEVAQEGEQYVSQADIKKLTKAFEASFLALTTKDYTIEVQFLDAPAMQTLNREQRAKDKPTDVLSFPLFLNRSDWEKFSYPEVLLGTIVICPPYAIEQGTPLIDLVHHGILHILGYDHETDIVTWREIEHDIVEQAHHQGLLIHGIPSSL